MKLNLTPFARTALGADAIQRLRLHLTAARLSVVGPAPWTIRILADGGVFVRYSVPTASLWTTIAAGLSEVGVPLGPDEEWASIRTEVAAIA